VEAEEEPPAAGAGMAKTWRQYFVLVVFVIDSDDAATSIDTRINQVRADIAKVLQVDRTRGGYAHDTEFHESTPFDDPGGVALKISVRYRTLINDPYTLA